MENKGIKKTKKGWLIDIDQYTNRERYYEGSRAGQIIYTKDDPTQKYNVWFPTIADVIVGMLHDGKLYKNCRYYRKGYTVQ